MVAARAGQRRRRRLRLKVAGAFAIVALVAMCLQLVRVQLLGSFYSSYGHSEIYPRAAALPATRGAIYDRDGDLLAASVTRYNLVADDIQIDTRGAPRRPAIESAALAPILHVSAATLLPELSKKGFGYVVLAYLVPQSVVDRVDRLNLVGITEEPASQRVDPDGKLFTPLLGTVGFEQYGLAGIEAQYNSLLSGSAGVEMPPESPSGTQVPGPLEDVRSAIQGTSVVLTLDEPLQWEVTRLLSAQILATHAHSGVCVIADPHTGDILAMVDLIRVGKKVLPAAQNLALTAVYQPGSVMKLVTVSGALESGLIHPDSELSVPDSTDLGGYEFADAEFHPTERMSVATILAQSSNVGTIEIAAKLGPRRLYHFLRLFGYGSPTGLDWPGESAGLLSNPSAWWGSSMGSIPIGTGEAVTPMQVLDAYNAIANGGVFVPPRLVDATISGGGVEHVVPMARRHRILDASTAAEVVPLLEGVVADGTATAAQIRGYQVAGKTGTAQIPSTTGPGYQAGAWMATFVGFLPAQDPQLSGIVVLDHPTPIYGGTVSAPVFSEIMRYALRRFDVPPADRATASPPAETATDPAP